jgi:LuxR family maltose regulon positive regulatory protein
MQEQPDATSFIQSFTGSHHFVLDYLLEEVLGQQPEHIQTFLLRTSIIDRLCGPLCDAVLLDAGASGQATLEYLERANLFIVPLDNERRWYRYHHLFADLLLQRLHQSIASSIGNEDKSLVELHIRASQWYEDHDLELEAFQHAAAAHDVERAARLVEGKGMPLHFRGAVAPILSWLESLQKKELDARPWLWVSYASLLLVTGQTTGVEEKLQAAEAALQDTEQGAEAEDQTRDLAGQIAAIRATLALIGYQVAPMLAQSRRALEYLRPNNLSLRASAHWTLGVAYNLQGDRAAARQAYSEAIALSQAAGDSFNTILSTISLSNVQEADNELYLAAETYRHALQLLGEKPLPIASEAHLGLARICYEWNDLDAAQQHAQQSLQLARQFDRVLDRFVIGEVFLARLKLAQGDVAGAAALLAEAGQSTHQQNFVNRLPEIAATQVLLLLRQGNLAAAAHLAQMHELPLSQARVHLAQGNPSAALVVLEPWRQQVEARGWKDERLKVLVLQAVALQAHGEQDQAVQLLCDALSLAEPGDFIRLFVDEGLTMARLLSGAAALGMMPDYLGKVLAACEAEQQLEVTASQPPAQPLIEPLSPRELEVLQLMAQGRSNQEISEQLFLALSTVKGHNRNIFGKLQVQRRTEAVARARELGLL